MKTYIQFLGTTTPDTTPALLLHFDTKTPMRYLFNCGESTQRFCLENKIRLPKLQNIFATRVDWETLGGLPGTLLTMADAGVAKTKVLGGKNLTHFLAAARNFVIRSTMTVETHEFPEDGMEFKDNNLTIKPILIHPENLKPFNEVAVVPSSSTSRVSVPSKRSHDSALGQAEQKSAIEYKKKVLSLMFNQSQRELIQPKKKKRNVYREEEAVFDIDNGPSSAEQERESTSKEQNLGDQRRELFPKRLPRSEQSRTTIAYVCKGPDYKGKFNPQAAAALGLKPGPLYAKLANGNIVTTPDGTEVHPHQVLSDARAGFIFIIADVPTVDHISSLVESPELAVHQSNDKNLQPGLIIHILGNGVLEDERYRIWMNKFGSNTEHIISNEEFCPKRVIFNHAARSQYKLSKIDENHFCLPYYSNEPLKALEAVLDLPKKITLASPLLIYEMEPKPKLDTSHIPPIFNHHYEQSLIKNEDYLAAVKELKKELETLPSPAMNAAAQDLIITTLGTGSSLPSKYRNVSGNLLTIPKYGSVIFDAGEGTFGTLTRVFGPLGGPARGSRMDLDEIIKGLKCIFISHLHADHHLGTMGILNKWGQVNKDDPKARLYVVAPGRFLRWLDEYSDVEVFAMSKLRLVDNRDILPNSRLNAKVLGLLKELGLKAITAVEVIHCPSAYGICLQHNDGWKIVYSGDTRPCENLIRIGKDATLLIHEATFENAMQEDAIAKRHCTTEEAIYVSKRMGAKSTLLTHFSQRYPKVPVFTEAHKNIAIGFDMMQVRLGDFHKLPKYVKALKILYGDDCEEAKEANSDDSDPFSIVK